MTNTSIISTNLLELDWKVRKSEYRIRPTYVGIGEDKEEENGDGERQVYLSGVGRRIVTSAAWKSYSLHTSRGV